MELVINENIKQKNTEPTICLNMIVKNESKVITRMFDAIIDVINCYCICDTGSTDDTVDIITSYFLEKGISGKIIYYPFKNFAHNRNVALQSCKGMSDYVLLLDADMILKISDKFVKTALKEDFYFLFQGNESFYYQNVRIVKNNGLFSYSGVTHEYVNVPPRSIGGKVFDKKIIFIHDIGDGGAKSDKFKRDIILLEQGLIDEPNNTRYMFYLGNSYRDYGDDDKAIETYKKQLNMNAWKQEKYCSCISIGNIYYNKNDKVNAAKYWLKSSEYDNERIEGIVKAVDYYRHEGENVLVNFLYHKYKGYKRNLAEGKLFVEQNKYNDILEFNNSISAYYANDKESGYDCCKEILLNGVMDISNMKKTLENIHFYKNFLLKDTKEVREKLFTCIDKLLELENEKKNGNEIWTLLHNDIIEEVIIVTPLEINLEDVYQKIRQFRIEGKSQEAMDLYNSINKDHPKYSEYLWKLVYEYSIFSYYTGIRNINQQIVTILNKCDDSNLINSILSNMQFYPNILNSEKIYDYTFTLKHKINDIEYNFSSSSSCIIPYNDGYLLNVRLVNYIIDQNGYYNECEPYIITINKSIEINSDFTIIREKLIDVDFNSRRYIGIEDVRIIKDGDKILFTGTGYHTNNTVGVVYGQYSEVNYICGKPLNSLAITPAFNLNSNCEKNWVYFEYKRETHMIYDWYPLKICKINKNILDIVEEKTMPIIFKNARGSTCGFKYKISVNNYEIWFVVHIVSYESPRHYYHILVVFDENMNLLRYTAPFKFEGEKIEYCLGLVVEDDRIIMTYSTWDRSTKVGVYSKKYIDNLTIY
jgi:tetratricopeptide (TPR) repeat protein